MKTITLTDIEAEVLACHICELLQRLDITAESTTQMTAVEDAEIKFDIYSKILKQLGYNKKDLENWEIVLKR